MGKIRKLMLSALILGIALDIFIRSLGLLSSNFGNAYQSSDISYLSMMVSMAGGIFLLALLPASAILAFIARAQGEPESESWAIFLYGIIAALYGYFLSLPDLSGIY